ncbi:galactose mutarotase [Lecanosticta acicola]|uniref:Galactose mutarotase n=1 Tax=Lecanosticta acicola TaxID=111012 RepID=A0AAI8YWI4_9PEZI|nr:galactose mutarotase [Lecanosticta acicola]
MLTQGFLAALAILPVFSTADIPGNTPQVLPNGKYEIASEGIRAQFIPYAASITNLFIRDVHGVERDVVLGFDNATYYSISRLHPHLNGVPGRYANRIKNSTFAIDGKTYHVDANDNGGRDTLHGGSDGWDYRNWTVTAHTADSITFSLVDPDGKEGFPGEVTACVTYTLTPYQWHLRMKAISTTKKTPIMLSSHDYWNLDGFQNPSTCLALNHSLHMPYARQRIAIDGIAVPTGEILANEKYGLNDFWSAPKQLGANLTDPELLGNCGTNCEGYDNCYLTNREQLGPYDWSAAPVATLASAWSGIQLDIYTDQQALQMYTCNNMNGTFALKETQGFFNDPSRPRVSEKYGCVVIEVEDWIDGINNPQWGRDKRQIFGPADDPYVLQATYKFSLNHELATRSEQRHPKKCGPKEGETPCPGHGHDDSPDDYTDDYYTEGDFMEDPPPQPSY